MRFLRFFVACVLSALIDREAGAAANTEAAGGLLVAAADSASVHPTVSGPNTADLGPTSAVPWNPPRPLPSRGVWEQALLLPGRIASLPLVAIGASLDHSLYFVENTALIGKVTYVGRDLPKRFGVSLKPAQLGDRTGLGAAVKLRTPFLGGPFKNLATAELSASTRHYNSTLVTLHGHSALLQYGYEWRSQDRFHGVGIHSSVDSTSSYAMQSEFVRALAQWGWAGETKTLNPRVMVTLWGGPRNVTTRNGREVDKLSFDVRFPVLGTALLNRQVEHFIYGGSFSSDWRVGEPHWSQGWRVLLSAERFDRPIKAMALRVGTPRGAQFTRYVAETETGFSFYRAPRTVRFLVRLMNQDVSSDGDRFLISDMARLGGHQGVAGFEAGRLHDVDLVLTRVTYVFPLGRRLEMELHSEWGGVYSDVWEDAKLSTLKNSVGLSLRGVFHNSAFGSLGVDISPEGTRLRYSVGRAE